MLSTELFQKLIPAGTKARHKGNFVTIQGTPDQSGNIKILLPHNKQATVPVSELKPYLKTTGKVLMIDAEDPWKRHALARLTATERGNVEAVWDQFGQSGATLSLQGENALAAIIPVTSDQLEDLPKERISSSLSDGRKASGYVYQLLG